MHLFHTRIFFCLGCLLFGTVTNCSRQTSSTSDAVAPPAVPSAQVQRGEITRFITLPGTLRANQKAVLYAKVAGYMGQITVDKGDRVKEGQLLAEIEVPEVQADLKKYEADAKVARIELDRLTRARKQAPDLILPQALDNTRGALEVASAGIERTQALLKFAKITAPFDGVITMRYLDPGAFIPAAASGSPDPNAAIVALMDARVVRVQIAVPEAETAYVRNGQPVKVKLEALKGRVFEGNVSRFTHALEETTRTMLVEVDLQNHDETLRPGMYAMVHIGLEKHENTLLVPASAVVTEKNATFVFKLHHGKAQKTAVTLGLADGEKVELLQGVAPGETVLLVGKHPLTDGQPVKIAP